MNTRNYIGMLAHIKLIMPFFVLFFYIYPQFLVGIPLSTRVFLGLLGFVVFLINRRFLSSFFTVFKGAVPIVLVSIITALLNRTFDFCFVFYVVSMLLIYFAAYLFTLFFPKLIKSDNCLIQFLYLFVWVVAVQSLLAMLMYISPGLNELLNSIFPMQNSEQREQLEGMRLMGLGIAFFGAGVVNGLALIAIVYLYLAGYLKNTPFWIGIFMFIFFIGMMMARTTVVGFCISMIFLFSWEPLHISTLKSKIKWMFFMAVILVLAIVIIFTVVDEQLLLFVFEFFYKHDAAGSFESASTNQLQEMYIYPSQLKTWLIGDGIYNTVDGHYYMSTDVGFLRLLFYGGMPMVAAYYYFAWSIIHQTKKLGITTLQWNFLLFAFLYLVVLGFKGLADINFLFLLFFVCRYQQKKAFCIRETIKSS